MAANRSRRARAARRRKRRLDRVLNDLTGEEWETLKAAWNGCAYCGATDGPLQRDCVMAISRGGRYTVDNVVPACATCNASKCNDEVTSWLRRKRLDERNFLMRYIEIRADLAVQPMDENDHERAHLQAVSRGVSPTDTHTRKNRAREARPRRSAPAPR